MRASLKQCSGCGIMHRRDRACRWCGARVASTWRSARVLGAAAGVAVMAVGAVGTWLYREPIRDGMALVVARAFAPGAAAAPNADLTDTPARPSPAATREAPPKPVAPLNTADSEALGMTVAADSIGVSTVVASAADTIVWIPAVARTWVNVHVDASRGGDVIGVINPSSRAMLGTTRAGWRQVRSPDVSGWVDPKLFERDSLRTRGL